MNKNHSIPLSTLLQLPPPAENIWLQELRQFILANLTADEFDVPKLANLLQMSPRSLYYKVKKLTDFSPAKYINELRLQKAAQLLQNQSYLTVSEVCYAVGFQKPAYFSLLFKRQFGVLPSSLLRKGGRFPIQ